MPVQRKNLKKTESIQLKVIAAINAAERVTGMVEKAKLTFDEIKSDVEEAKSEMDLGLKQHEAEVEEKKAGLNDEYDVFEKERQEKLDDLDAQIKTKEASNKREIEQMNYDHNKAKERDSLATAEVIAEKYDKMIVNSDYEQKFEEAKAEEITKLKEVHDAELKEKSRGYAIAENKLKASNVSELALAETKLEAAIAANTKLEADNVYLKTQLEAAREEITKAVEAAKTNVVNNIDQTKK